MTQAEQGSKLRTSICAKVGPETMSRLRHPHLLHGPKHARGCWPQSNCRWLEDSGYKPQRWRSKTRHCMFGKHSSSRECERIGAAFFTKSQVYPGFAYPLEECFVPSCWHTSYVYTLYHSVPALILANWLENVQNILHSGDTSSATQRGLEDVGRRELRFPPIAFSTPKLQIATAFKYFYKT